MPFIQEHCHGEREALNGREGLAARLHATAWSMVQNVCQGCVSLLLLVFHRAVVHVELFIVGGGGLP